MSDDKEYWFPAKSVGWGWGVPCSWQGWTVFFLFILAMFLLPLIFDPGEKLVPFIVSVVIATSVLLVICYIKGEPLNRS